MPPRRIAQPASRHAPPCYRHTNGFALVATLALLGLVLACVLILSSLIQLQGDRIEAETHRTIARNNARVALDIAIAQLQLTTGTDRVVTLPAATLLDASPSTLEIDGVAQPYWTYALHVPSGRAEWLVSGAYTADPREALPPEQAVTLVGAGTADPDDPRTWVQAPKVWLRSQDGTNTSAYAYWIGEINTRAALALTDPLTDALDPAQRGFLQRAQPRRSAIEAWHPDIEAPDSTTIRKRMDQTQVDSQLFFLRPDRDALRRSYHDVTARSFSVLSNVIDGGLKLNLSAPGTNPHWLTSEMRLAVQPYPGAEAPAFQVQGDDPSQAFGISQTLTPGEVIQLHQPILTEFSLSMGIFHTQSDRRHRLRYHLHAEWLNPYPYDMVFRNQRAFVVLIDQLPELEVLNESSGQRFTVDLNDFDPTLRYNNLSQSKIHAWMEFDRLSKFPARRAPRGIDAGRVYRMTEPDKVSQPQGLARTLQEAPNLWRWGGAERPVAGPAPDNTIYGNDTIRIRSIGPVRMNLSVLPLGDGQPIPNDLHPDAFAAQKGAVLQLKHIPFDDIDIRLSGSSYSRSTSGSFNPNDYRLAFQFKLREQDASVWQTLAESLSFRSPQIDFTDSVTRSVYEIRDVASAARSADPLTDQERFWDDTDRENATAPHPEEWQFFLYDIPLQAPVSPGIFSQLHFHQRPHPWVGSASARNSGLNGAWDRSFFSGPPLQPNAIPQTQPDSSGARHARRFHNLRIHPIANTHGSFASTDVITGPDGAAHSLLEGGFNIFSASPEAWMIFLKNEVEAALFPPVIRASPTSETIPNVFARLPFAAGNLPRAFADSGIDASRQRNRLLYQQGVRILDGDPSDPDTGLRSLAESIVREIRSELATPTALRLPITSLEDLINLGTIDRAIASATLNVQGLRINNDVDPLSPGYLRQSDLLGLLGSRMTTRSDTFVIRCYGESAGFGSRTPAARAWAEAVVQRFPYYMQPGDPAMLPAMDPLNLSLGRRYRVLHFRWLQPHDI